MSHFIAINEKDGSKIKEALDNWYENEKKNYDVFAEKYPVNGELELQIKKISQMYTWCSKERITRTPTIFINNYELSKEYIIEDLREVLN